MYTSTKTLTILEIGKLYKVTGGTVDLVDPKNDRDKSFWDAERTCSLLADRDEYILALETENEPEHGAWVVYGKRRLWLPGEYFCFLQRV